MDKVTPDAEENQQSLNKNQQQQSLDANDNLLMISLSRFYRQPEHMDAILPIVNGESGISLRLIDYFITNYSKRYNVLIPHTTSSGHVVHFNVFVSYRAQLRAYSKQAFDCFRRRDRVLFCYDRGGKSIETTIGQLNVFRWLITNGILRYIEDHLEDINKDMMSGQKQSKKDLQTKDKETTNASGSNALIMSSVHCTTISFT
jgi:hypothetical protein